MRKDLTVFAALAAAALAATPLVMSASRALATQEAPTAITASLRVEPVEVASVAAAPKAEGMQAPCLRKVRVVYGGYNTPADACAAR